MVKRLGPRGTSEFFFPLLRFHYTQPAVSPVNPPPPAFWPRPAPPRLRLVQPSTSYPHSGPSLVGGPWIGDHPGGLARGEGGRGGVGANDEVRTMPPKAGWRIARSVPTDVHAGHSWRAGSHADPGCSVLDNCEPGRNKRTWGLT